MNPCVKIGGHAGLVGKNTAIRADCQAETAAVLALHARLKGDPRSRAIARHLLD
jgi:hypothetical protein